MALMRSMFAPALLLQLRFEGDSMASLHKSTEPMGHETKRLTLIAKAAGREPSRALGLA
jgi:hypothetical protein